MFKKFVTPCFLLQFPESKKLKTNSESKIFIYFNGHGGDNFFKIQDTEVLQSNDLGKVYHEMNLKKMYKEIVMIIDTCQAMSLFDDVEAPNLILIGSSSRNESAYSHQYDADLNTGLNDKFTFYFHLFLHGRHDQYSFSKNTRLSQFPQIFNRALLDSNLEIKSTHVTKKLSDVHLYEYIPLPGHNTNNLDLQFYDLKDFDDEVLLY